MALYEQHDPRAHVGETNYAARSPALSTGAVILFVATVIAVLMIAVLYPGRENTGPSVQTVNPAPSSSTSPPVPTPGPNTEPRPTQAPIQ